MFYWLFWLLFYFIFLVWGDIIVNNPNLVFEDMLQTFGGQIRKKNYIYFLSFLIRWIFFEFLFVFSSTQNYIYIYSLFYLFHFFSFFFFSWVTWCILHARGSTTLGQQRVATIVRLYLPLTYVLRRGDDVPIVRTQAEPQMVVARSPLPVLQYPVLNLSRMQRIESAWYLNLRSH